MARGIRPHVTTNHDLRRLRACAAIGLSIAETARCCGVTRATAVYWGRRLELDFPRKKRPSPWRIDRAAPDKLAAIMAQLHAASD